MNRGARLVLGRDARRDAGEREVRHLCLFLAPGARGRVPGELCRPLEARRTQPLPLRPAGLDEGVGDRLGVVRIREQEEDATRIVLNGASYCRSLTAGYQFEVTGAPTDSLPASPNGGIIPPLQSNHPEEWQSGRMRRS